MHPILQRSSRARLGQVSRLPVGGVPRVEAGRCRPSPQRLRPRPGSGGFGGADLLAVLAVLCLTAAILLPILRRGRTQASLAQCTANLQQIGRAVLAYAEEQKGRMPALENAPSPGAWWYYKDQVKSFAGAGAGERLFVCPADRGYNEGTGRPVPFGTSARHNRTSYVFNGVNLPGIPNIAGATLASIKDPARTLMVMEWTAHAPLSWHRSKTREANSPFYNDAESVVVFADGHAKLIPIFFDGINAAYTRDPIAGYEYKYSGN